MDLIRPAGKIRRPTRDELRELGESEYMQLTEAELTGILELADQMLSHIDHLDELEEPQLPQRFNNRDGGRRPTREEDPYNIFITKCWVEGAKQGRLLGKKVGLKDSISLRGIPMTNASRVCQGYIPNIDATVVTKLLEEGAVVVGKLNMDEFSFSSTSETSFYGAVRNPSNPEYSPGGSSSGAGAAVANGDVDIAIAVDGGGSGRMPAARTGVTSIKPTHGLVSTFGTTYVDHTMDHVCPVTRTVSELAEALEVIAGPDESDPQWTRTPPRMDQYTKHLVKGVSSIKIGVLKEAFEWPSPDLEVDAVVRKSLSLLAELGANVREASVPLFKFASSMAGGIVLSSASAMFESNGDGYWHEGRYNTHWNEFFGSARKARSNEFSAGLKQAMLIGKYLRKEYYGVHHAKAMNMRSLLKRQVEEALREFDVLAMATCPRRPSKLHASTEFGEMGKIATAPVNNCAPFNLTGHPALTLPCGMTDGLPVGLQVVGRQYDESTLFRVAYSFEQSFDWKKI